MRTKSFLSVLCSLFFLLILGGKVAAQVAIGIGEPPVGGTLLQIRNVGGVSGANTNANKGMLLPRVNLTDINMLYPMFPVGYNKQSQDAVHAGLVVYNTNVDLLKSNGVGIYLWDGKIWKALSGEDGGNMIDINPTRLFLSEIKITDIATVLVGKSGQNWNVTSSGVNGSSSTSDIQKGKSTPLTFLRSNTEFGDKIYTFTLRDQPNIIGQLEVCNLELKINRQVIRVGEGSVNGVVNSSTAIEPIGGDAKWEIVDYSRDAFNWTVPPKNEGGRLVFELGAVKGNGGVSVFGEIKVRHVNDSGLVKIIKVEQNKEYRVLPPFDYMVIRYEPGRPLNGVTVDIDSATEILKSNVRDVDGKPVGYVGTTISSASANGISYMYYAGDEKTTGSETSYVNIPRLNEILGKYPASSNQIEVGMSAWWFAINASTAKEAMVTISLYKGGTMVQNGTTFENKIDNVIQMPLLQFSSAPKRIAVKGRDSASQATYKTYYTPMYKLEYDRVDNTGVLIQWNAWE